MSTKTRTIEQTYIVCDWCEKEILEGEKRHTISGDFPSISIHEDTCLRQSIYTAIKHKTK